MDVRAIVGVLRRRWHYLVAGLLLGVLAGVLVALLVPGRYTSVTTLALEPTVGGDYGTDYQGTLLANQRVGVYVPLISQPRVTDQVAGRVGQGLTSQDVAAAVEASTPADTSLISVVVTDSSPERAQAVASATADAVASVVDEVERSSSGGQNPGLRAQVVQPASFSPIRVSAGPALQVGVAALLGVIAAAVVLGVRESLDTAVPTGEALARQTGFPLLGEIEFESGSHTTPLPEGRAPPERVEAFRSLRAALSFREPDGEHPVIAVAGPRTGDGATLTAAGLAVVLAAAGRSVLVVEADLRRPRLAALFALDPSRGLAAAVDAADPASVVQHRAENLHVLPAGPAPDDPTLLLGPRTLGALLARLKDRYDVVLVDVPACLPLADAGLAVARADATLLVVGSGRATRDDVARTRALLAETGTAVLGVVFTRTSRRRARPAPPTRDPAADWAPPTDRRRTPTTPEEPTAAPRAPRRPRTAPRRSGSPPRG